MLARNLLEFAEEGLVLASCSDKVWMLSVSMRRSEDDFPSLAELACIGNCLQGEACHGCARSVMLCQCWSCKSPYKARSFRFASGMMLLLLLLLPVWSLSAHSVLLHVHLSIVIKPIPHPLCAENQFDSHHIRYHRRQFLGEDLRKQHVMPRQPHQDCHCTELALCCKRLLQRLFGILPCFPGMDGPSATVSACYQ